MRILHIFDDYGTPGERALPGEGSVSSIAYNLARHTSARGHDVTILERDHGYLSETEIINGIRFVRIKAETLPAPPYRLIKQPLSFLKLLADGYSVAKKINKYIKANDFDVIHAHFPFAVNVLITLNSKIREKMVYTAHVGEEAMRFNFGSNTPLALSFFSPDLYLMKRVKKSVVLNEPLKSRLLMKGLTEENLEVIPNGVNTDEYGKITKEIMRQVQDKYELTGKTVVMFAGTVTPRKGIEPLLKAAQTIVNHLDRRDIIFLIVGNLTIDPEFTFKAKKYIVSQHLENYVKLTGFVSAEDLRRLYATCDIFILPSFEEGDPISLKEALASEKPLIGTKIGGIPLQIKDGWNGFLVEPGNVEQIVEKIQYLIKHPADRKKMGKNSRKLAVENFDWCKISERYLMLYKKFGFM